MEYIPIITVFLITCFSSGYITYLCMSRKFASWLKPDGDINNNEWIKKAAESVGVENAGIPPIEKNIPMPKVKEPKENVSMGYDIKKASVIGKPEMKTKIHTLERRMSDVIKKLTGYHNEYAKKKFPETPPLGLSGSLIPKRSHMWGNVAKAKSDLAKMRLKELENLDDTIYIYPSDNHGPIIIEPKKYGTIVFE